MLSNAQKKELRKIAHQEKAIVFVGKHGLVDSVYDAFDEALYRHNLVKISVSKNSPIDVKEVAEDLAREFDCEIVSIVGRVCVLYRYSNRGRIKV